MEEGCSGAPEGVGRERGQAGAARDVQKGSASERFFSEKFQQILFCLGDPGLIQPFQKTRPVPAKAEAPASAYLAFMLRSNIINCRHAGPPVPAAIASTPSSADSHHRPSIFIFY